MGHRRAAILTLVFLLFCAVALPTGAEETPGAGTPDRAAGSSAPADTGTSGPVGPVSPVSPVIGPPPGTPLPTQTGWTPRQFTVVGSGDVLLHSGLWHQAARDAQAAGRSGYDFRPMLAGVAATVSAADLAICHLETPLGRPGGPFSGYPIFNAPPQIAPALHDTGYDACSTASNHTLDKGEAGIRRTLDALDAAGLRHTGSARTPAEAATPTILEVRGVRVALLSYTFSFNGLRRPAGRAWVANLLDGKAVRSAARRARSAGAEVVILSVHWGTEYQHAPNEQQRRIARDLLGKSDVDLILGHHAHVVQPFERIGDGWVAYGLGNHLSWQSFSDGTRDGVLGRFTLTETAPGRFGVTRAEASPTLMSLDRRPARLLEISRALRDQRLPQWQRQACQASWRRSAGHLRSRGGPAAGLTVVR